MKIEEGLKNGTITDLEALKAKTSQFGENKVAKEVNVASTTHEPETPLIYQIPPPTFQKPPIYQRPSTRRRCHQFSKPRNNF